MNTANTPPFMKQASGKLDGSALNFEFRPLEDVFVGQEYLNTTGLSSNTPSPQSVPLNSTPLLSKINALNAIPTDMSPQSMMKEYSSQTSHQQAPSAYPAATNPTNELPKQSNSSPKDLTKSPNSFYRYFQQQQQDLSPLPSNIIPQYQQLPISNQFSPQQLQQTQQQQQYPLGNTSLSPMSLYEQMSMLSPPYSPPYMMALLQQQKAQQNQPYSPPQMNSSPLFNQFQAIQPQMQMQLLANTACYDMAKYPHLLPMGMPLYGQRQRKGLTPVEIEALYLAANGHVSATRSKRDLAILSLILDMHLSSGTITRMTMKNVNFVRRAVHQGIGLGELSSFENFNIDIPNSSGYGTTSSVPCHPLTAWALTCWIQDLHHTYKWDLNDDELPLFVNSQPLFSNVNGEKSLRKIPLKRDAISKVFQSIKQRSGVSCHKSIVATTNLNCVTSFSSEWIKRFQLEWMDKEH